MVLVTPWVTFAQEVFRMRLSLRTPHRPTQSVYLNPTKEEIKSGHLKTAPCHLDTREYLKSYLLSNEGLSTVLI